jgi:hemolysin-activating ACP:hemolysin acyltransferase
MFRTLGEVTSIILNSDRKSMKVASIGAFVFPYVRLNQVAVFYGENRYPAGYMVWAYLTDSKMSELSANPAMLLSTEDLNAGDNMVVIDIVSHLRSLLPIVRKIRKITAGNYEFYYGLRFDKAAKSLALRRYRVRQLSPR